MNIKRLSYKDSTFYSLYNFKDTEAKGRACMLISAVYTSVFTCINNGVFYTGFLISNNINIVNVGIISFLPFFAGMFSIFSPYILERFKKRRLILTVTRIIYYTLSLFASTIMPRFVSEPSTRVLLFCIIVFLANLTNALFVSPGYSAWQINFLPDRVRVNYFSITQIISSVISSVFFLFSTIMTDRIKDFAQQGQMINTIRYITFALAIVETMFLLLPKEFPYETTVKVKIKNIFVLPIKNKMFMATMLIIFCWSFVQYSAMTPVDYFLINNIGVKYTFISIITLLYSVFLLIFSGMWRKIISKYGWFKIFAVTAFFQGLTTLLYAFITKENYIIIMLVVRMTQHLVGVGLNLTYANMLYINMPKSDRTNYVSFFIFFASVAMFFGLLCGTAFVGATKDFGLTVLGFTFTSVPILMLFQAFGQLVIGAVVYLFHEKLEPEHE